MVLACYDRFSLPQRQTPVSALATTHEPHRAAGGARVAPPARHLDIQAGPRAPEPHETYLHAPPRATSLSSPLTSPYGYIFFIKRGVDHKQSSLECLLRMATGAPAAPPGLTPDPGPTPHTLTRKPGECLRLLQVACLLLDEQLGRRLG